jgi:hypothetical protein
MGWVFPQASAARLTQNPQQIATDVREKIQIAAYLRKSG